MSDVCSDPSYTCPSFDTKPQLAAYSKSISLHHTADRVFSLILSNKTIEINKRDRSYSYSQNESISNSNGKVVLVPDGFGVAYIDCYTQTEQHNSSITENYSTTDCTFMYVDLRTDLVVYEENVQTLLFDGEQSDRVPVKTTYDDAYLYPYIKEEVPIIVTNKIYCTAIAGPLYEEHINSGYWNGVRILMPLFNSGDPRKGFKFTIDGIEYDAGEVDWYYINAEQREADGDQFFWWADWNKAVGVNNEVDVDETKSMAATQSGMLKTPATVSSSNGVITKLFKGAAAVEKNDNIFLSMSVDIPEMESMLISKLIVNDIDVEIPQETGEETADAWYPIAPL